MRLRIKFTKNGCLKFIGHLDVMRYFQKAMRRAKIDIAYSAGFSPHQIMSFAAPLGVGMTSDGEYFDMEANSVTSAEDIKTRLNAVMAEGIVVTDVRLLPEGAKNAMASVSAAGYTVRIRAGHDQDVPLAEAVARFHSSEHVPYVKQTQKSELTLDLKEGVHALSVEKDTVSMVIDTGSSSNLKPAMIMETLYSYYGKQPEDFDFVIHRNETYGRAEDGSFVPLSEAGEVF